MCITKSLIGGNAPLCLWGRCLFIVVSIGAGLCAHAAKANSGAKEENLQTITVYNVGWTPELRRYHLKVLRAILDYSTEQYGPYTLKTYDKGLPVKRELRELERGELFQADFTSSIQFHGKLTDKGVDFPLALHQNLLGLRKLVVRRSQRALFQDVTTAEQFTRYRAGQGFGWQDVKIYRHAGVSVFETVKTQSLLSMLAVKRFDFLPLSVIEVDEYIAAYAKEAEDLIVLEGVYIYYPIPTYLSVSREKPLLEERIRFGLSQLDKYGALAHLFYGSFQRVMDGLNTQNAKLIVLSNPLVSDDDNLDNIPTFIRQYFPDTNAVIYLTDILELNH